MLRLTDTRGSRSWPASFHAARYASICLRCWTWSGSPLSSNLSVELCRFMPSFAAQTAVAFDAAPHQIRSRRPAECGSRRSRPGGLGNIGRGFGCGEALALEDLEEDLGVPARHVGVGLALGGRVAEVAAAVDHLLRRPAADAELEPAAGDEVGRARVLGHVQRVLVAHVDDGRADLDARSCARRSAASSGNGEASWRAKWWTRKYAPSAPSSSAATASSIDWSSASDPSAPASTAPPTSARTTGTRSSSRATYAIARP